MTTNQEGSNMDSPALRAEYQRYSEELYDGYPPAHSFEEFLEEILNPDNTALRYERYLMSGRHLCPLHFADWLAYINHLTLEERRAADGRATTDAQQQWEEEAFED